MSWHFLQEQEAASWEAICLDGAPSALLKLMPTAAVSCCVDKPMACCPSSQSGTTSAPSMDSHGEAKSTSLAEDSRVKTSAQPEKALASTVSAPDSGERWRGSFVRYSPSTSSWKTPQHSLFGGSDEFLETWPRWGSMQSGACWARTMPAHLTGARDSGFWPTPLTAYDGRSQDAWVEAKARADEKRRNGLYKKGCGSPGMMDLQRAVRMRSNATGRLNPRWTEWLMGWPIGWSSTAPLETDRFRQWLKLHGRH